MIRLAERTWREAARLAADPRSVVLLPLGAIEQHGPHLPLLVDWLGAEELARRVAPHLRRAGFRPLLLPGLPYGASPLARGFAGTIGLSARTLVTVVTEILAALATRDDRRARDAPAAKSHARARMACGRARDGAGAGHMSAARATAARTPAAAALDRRSRRARDV